MYVNFGCSRSIENLKITDTAISTNEKIEIEGLIYGLGYEVDISEGKIKFIEFITYGENWNGSIGNFLILKKD